VSRIVPGTFAVKDGPSVRVRLHLPRADVRELRRLNRPVRPPVDVRALIDTRAECSCVRRGVLDPPGLAPFGVFPTNAPALGGFAGAFTFGVSLAVLHPSGDGRRNLVVPDIDVTELDLGSLGYDALLGRDVLARCVLTYDGPNSSFTLAY
jgi:hypothetical protein